jgi:hypothetical protein
MGVTSMGIPLASAEEADTLWVEDIPTAPPVQEEVPQDLSSDEIPLDDIQTSEESPLEEGGEDIPLEDVQTEEGVVPEGEEEIPQEDTVTPEEEAVPQNEFPAEEEEGAEPIVPEEETEQVTPDEDLTQEEVTPPEETPVDETGQMQEEVPVGQEEFVNEEIPAEGGEIPTEGEVPVEEVATEEASTDPNALKMQLMELVDADPERAAQLLAESQTEEAPIDEQQVEGEPQVATFDQLKQEEEVTPTDEVPTDESSNQDFPNDDPELIYCPECDRDVTQADIDACEEPYCPFKQKELPDDTSEQDIAQKKHYIITDHDDHCDCDVHQIQIKGFTGIEGEYCLTHQKLIHYTFDQDQFTPEQAKAWVQKQFKANKIKNKTAEEIVIEKIDSLTDVELKAWLSPKMEIASDEVDIDPQMVTDTLERVLQQAFQKQVMEPFESRLKELEA